MTNSDRTPVQPKTLPAQPDPAEWLTYAQAAMLYRVSARTLQRLAQAGYVTRRKAGGPGSHNRVYLYRPELHTALGYAQDRTAALMATPNVLQEMAAAARGWAQQAYDILQLVEANELPLQPHLRDVTDTSELADLLDGIEHDTSDLDGLDTSTSDLDGLDTSTSDLDGLDNNTTNLPH